MQIANNMEVVETTFLSITPVGALEGAIPATSLLNFGDRKRSQPPLILDFRWSSLFVLTWAPTSQVSVDGGRYG
jgi:hypothetical protein